MYHSVCYSIDGALLQAACTIVYVIVYMVHYCKNVYHSVCYSIDGVLLQAMCM